jgi:hypothetical protein
MAVSEHSLGAQPLDSDPRSNRVYSHAFERFIFYRGFRKNPQWRPLASWTLAACIVIILAIALLKVA